MRQFEAAELGENKTKEATYAEKNYLCLGFSCGAFLDGQLIIT